MKKLIITIVVMATTVPCPARSAAGSHYGSGWYQEVQVSFAWQNNTNRAWRSADRKSDTIMSLGLGLGHSQKLGTRGQLEFGAWFTANRHDRFDGMDNVVSALAVAWAYQPEPGFQEPWYELSGELVRHDYRNADLREGYLLVLDGAMNKRVSPRLTALLGVRHHNRVKAESAAYDTTTAEIYLGADYHLEDGMNIVAEYSYGRGDFPANNSTSLDRDEPRSRDPVFGGWTYRLDADVHQLNLGWVAQYDRFNVDVSTRFLDASSRDIDYDDWLLQLGLVWLL